MATPIKIKNMRFKIYKIFFPFFLIFSFCFTAFGAEPSNSNSKPLTVVLDWFVNPNHAPLLVAQEKGFFKQQGLQVRLLAPTDPNDGPKLVATHKAEIALTYQPQLLLQINQGLPLMRFATLVNTPLNCLVT